MPEQDEKVDEYDCLQWRAETELLVGSHLSHLISEGRAIDTRVLGHCRYLVAPLSNLNALQDRKFRDIRDECESYCGGQYAGHKNDRQSRHHHSVGR